MDSLNSERASLLAKAKCAHRKVVRHAKRVAVFQKNSRIHPPLHIQKSTYLSPSKRYSEIVALCFIRACFESEYRFRGGWIRLIAQGCTCANCPSVSTERWFGAHSARRFEKPPIHPLGKQKSTSRDVLFCWWRGVDSNHRSH